MRENCFLWVIIFTSWAFANSLTVWFAFDLMLNGIVSFMIVIFELLPQMFHKIVCPAVVIFYPLIQIKVLYSVSSVLTFRPS